MTTDCHEFFSSGQIKLQQNVDVEKGVNGRNDLVPNESTLEGQNGDPDPTVDVISETERSV